MTLSASVFVLQHLHVHDSGDECWKMIEIYASRGAAEEAAVRLAKQSGFQDHPGIIDDPVHDVDESGFYIDEYRINEDHWTDGYVTV